MENIFVVTVDCYSFSDKVPAPLNYAGDASSKSKNCYSCYLFTTNEERDIKANEFNFYFPDWMKTYSKFIDSGDLLIRHISCGVYRGEYEEGDTDEVMQKGMIDASHALCKMMMELPFEWKKHMKADKFMMDKNKIIKNQPS